jgi:hypothetical protein
MHVDHSNAATLDRPTGVVQRDAGARVTVATGGAVSTLRCLSSGYLSGERRCGCHVPEHVVAAAWRRELERGRAHLEGFFRLTWRDGQWLGYGLRDGSVRGVYCPAHAVDRDQRAFSAIAGADRSAPAPAPHA